MAIDLRQALNAVSDIVQNRPPPIREFDQIYMKIGDVILHAEFIARKMDGRSLVFVGDGDAIGLCIAYLVERKIINYGPTNIKVLDLDERQVHSVAEFVRHNAMEYDISASLYNVAYPLPMEYLKAFDAFHINTPWGRYNAGESIRAFLERGIQLISPRGWGSCVIADNDELIWTEEVLRIVQSHALQYGMVVKEMVPGYHEYHLNDAPELRSCTQLFRMVDESARPENLPLARERLRDFYGREQPLRYRYVRETPRVNPHSAPTNTYRLEPLEDHTA